MLAGDRRCHRLDAQFLTAFADHRGPRVLTGLDVSAGRQPQARLAVRDEQQLPARAVEDNEVAHQVRRRDVRLAHPVDRGSAGDPPGGRLQVGALQGIPRFDATDQLEKPTSLRRWLVPDRQGRWVGGQLRSSAHAGRSH
ncbi:hypothetical protein AQJ67_19020 [Streptomyces caeruleatus]|uniref:Uncharacterized protein n=1 Tax=Streptomyces caeruleatus TaxID=661399 RepID=A0A101U260_9ACTN|nr:hypothetical protein AQJ67_19020 [Streptomyces caeruleatus]